MPGLNSSLNIGLSALQANQGALNVIGHNIANVNTPSYTRQRVALSSAIPQLFGNLQYGMGVSLDKITSVRDKFLDLQINQATARQQGAQTRYAGLQGIASIFQDDGSSGVGTLVQKLFQSFQDLAARPEDGSVRTNAVGKAQSLVNGLQSRYQLLSDQRAMADQSVASEISEINTLTAQIASLNRRIAGEPTQGSDNDGRDQRQALVNQLAQHIGIQAYEDSQGQLQITLENGAAPLVSGNVSFNMEVASTKTTDGYTMVNVNVSGTLVDVTSRLQEGSLGANLDLRDNTLAGYQQNLDELAAGLAQQINLQHRAGYALDGTTTNLDFFQGAAANGANGLPTAISSANHYKGMVMSLSVNSAISSNPSLIAASDAANSTGNNKNALLLAKLETAGSTIDTNGDGVGDSGPFSTFISSLANVVGTDVQSSETNSTTADNLMTALTNQRAQLSGVDLDEEAVNLITFQRGYQASARFLSVINDLTDQLVNQFGR